MYLIPFFNAFVLYICLENDQLLNKLYRAFIENVAVYFPKWLIKVLGGCILCTATWMGILEYGLRYCLNMDFWLYKEYILLILYNAVTTTILYRLLK